MIKKLCAQLTKRILKNIRVRKIHQDPLYQDAHRQKDELLAFMKTIERLNK